MDSDFEGLNELHKQADACMNAGDFKGALGVARQIQRLGEYPYTSYIVSGLLIDIGSALDKEEIILEGIGLLEKRFNDIATDERLAATASYNRANGYYALYAIKRRRSTFAYFSKTIELDKARHYFRKALEFNSVDPHFVSQIWVNLGNCFDNVGRVVEALDCYEKALKYEPPHSMALGNKGVAIFSYANVAGEHQGAFLKEAYSLISQALRVGVNYQSIPYFSNYLSHIESIFKDKKEVLENFSGYPGYEIKADSKSEQFLIEFCMKNRLYLNLCNFCQRCDAAIGDSVLIKTMIVALNPGESDPIEGDRYLRLSSFLNQIKQDYITARFLLILSQYKELNLDFVDRRVRIIDTLDYSIHNTRVELIKMSFKNLYGILDKIAYFVGYYLGLTIHSRDIDFHTIWYDKYRSKNRTVNSAIMTTQNLALNALFDLHLDFEGDGIYHYLKNTRDALTHRFINIRLNQSSPDDENMTRETLFIRTLELAKLTRSAVLYLLQFVYLEERKRKLGVKDIPILVAQEIPDNLKF